MSTLRANTHRPARRVWFAIFGAPAAWGLQGLVGWLVAERACVDGDPRLGALSGAGVRILELGILAAALVIAIAALIVGIGLWRRSGNAGVNRVHAFERPDFLAAVAVFVSAAFALGILLASFGTLVLPVCESVR